MSISSIQFQSCVDWGFSHKQIILINVLVIHLPFQEVLVCYRNRGALILIFGTMKAIGCYLHLCIDALKFLWQVLRKKYLENLEIHIILLLLIFISKQWSSLLVNWSLLINCFPKWKQEVIKCSSSLRWYGALTS